MSETSSEGDDSAALVDAIGRELSLGVGLKRYASGSVPAFAVGDEHVVKLFPPTERACFNTERAALTRLDGLLPIPTPRAIAAGERGHWLYIMMTRLSGCSLAEAWHEIETHDRFQLRIMAYALLHRYSNLRWYVERLPVLDTETLSRQDAGRCLVNSRSECLKVVDRLRMRQVTGRCQFSARNLRPPV
jgi:hypothetical protein